MSQHFLLSAKARSLSLAAVLRMTDLAAEAAFIRIRWPDGKAICPHCECAIAITAGRFRASWAWLWLVSHPWTGADIGSGPTKRDSARK